MSGFCGAGSADFRRTGGLADVGSGANLMAGAFLLLPLLLFRLPLPPWAAASFRRGRRRGVSSGFFFNAGGFSGFEGRTGTLPGAVPAGAM